MVLMIMSEPMVSILKRCVSSRTFQKDSLIMSHRSAAARVHMFQRGSLVTSTNDNEKQNTNSTSVSNSDWRQWFQSHEYQSLNHPSPYPDTKQQIQPLENNSFLDHSSRNLLQMLHDMTLINPNQSEKAKIHRPLLQSKQRRKGLVDVVSTQQCNYMISTLLSDPKLIHQNVSGLSHRAYMIWKKMVFCHQVHTNDHRSTQIGKNNRHRNNSIAIPKPNRETYLSVLKLHSQEKNDLEAPLRAYEIIQFMIKQHEAYPSWDTSPSSMIWNQCIASWANSAQEDKAYHVTRLILHEMDPNCLDISTYRYAFQACATGTTKRSRTLAENVVGRLWSHLKDDHPEILRGGSSMMATETNNATAAVMTDDKNPLNSYRTFIKNVSTTFVYICNAMSHITDEPKRFEILHEVLNTVKELGLLNAHIIKAYCTAVESDNFLQQSFGNYWKASNDIPTDNKYGHVYQKIPDSWKRNCQVNKYGW